MIPFSQMGQIAQRTPQEVVEGDSGSDNEDLIEDIVRKGSTAEIEATHRIDAARRAKKERESETNQKKGKQKDNGRANEREGKDKQENN